MTSNKIQVILDHLIFLFFPFIIDFLVFILYIELLPNKFVIKKEEGKALFSGIILLTFQTSLKWLQLLL